MVKDSKKRKICFVCISLRGGGTERIVTRLANHFSDDFDVHIVIVHDYESFYPLKSSVTLHRPHRGRARSRSFRALSMLRHISATVRRIEPGIILSFGELISPIARIATIGSGARFIVFNRESPIRSLRGHAGIVNPLVYPLADLVVTQTAQAKSLLQKRYRFSKFGVVPNPIKVQSDVSGLSERPKTVISVGYLGGDKNQQDLLQAFAASVHRHDWKLSIVGDGPDRSRLVSLAVSLQLDDRVEFLGERNDVPRLLSEARIFAFTSLSEGFPNALSEGLSNGCACISYDCVTGPSELIANDVSGLLVEAGNLRKYSAELERLMGDETLQDRLSCAGRNSIQRFSSDRVLSRFRRLIESSSAVADPADESSCV